MEDAVQTHGGKDWGALSNFVASQTKSHCYSRWIDALDPSIDRTSGRTCKWAEDEDTKLNDAVQEHGGKSWKEVAAVVPGRTL
jgi:hypothetical protein